MKQMMKRFLFPVIGLGSLIWFLIRVIPKPSRAAYPCMRAAAPIASTFVIYVLGLLSSVVLFKKARKYLYESRYILFSLTMFVAMILGVSSYLQNNKKVYAKFQSALEGPNQPMGQGVGIYPGRVVWIYDPAATDETCTNRNNDYWYQDSNTNQDVVNKMLSDALKKLTGKDTDATAWDAIFRYYNKTHGKGDVGYQSGEKFVFKINLNGLANWSSRLGNINTSPQIIYAVLDQLINVVGVAQADIGVGDPNFDTYDPIWNKCHAAFPGVKFWGQNSGRTPIVKSANKVLFSSDGTVGDWLPQAYLDAAYLINIPVFKKHHRAGISLTCKNHFGSIAPFNNGAWHWHFSLPCSEGGADVNHGDYGLYRCFVDIMGHKDLGGKTLLYVVDGLWSSTNWGHPPIKWRMAPFNNDWPSSIFVSQDPVALESVGFDFLYHEFDQNHPTEGAYDPSDNKGPFPHYAGVDDYLHQAADSLNWAAGVTYDPENDGKPLPRSLGAHEHWNNASEKKYSRNLGLDQGIELVSNLEGTRIADGTREIVQDFTLEQNYPNPFNSTTTIGFSLPAPSRVTLEIYNVQGQTISTMVDELMPAGHHVQHWDGLMANGLSAPSGVYFYRVMIQNGDHETQQVKKMILSK